VPVRKIWLGRERELAELDAALQDLGEGRGSLFLLTGEPGIGKTRLADELAFIAAKRGIAVHWGRSWEAGGAPSYWPFIQVLRSMCRSVDPALIGALLGSHGSPLLELLPELRSTISVMIGGHAAKDRFQLFDAVGTFVREVASRAPQLVVLDDLHAADPSSLLLLQFLVKDLRSVPVLVVGTYREAEARLAPEIGSALVRLSREATLLSLRRLDQSEVAAFVTQATGAAVSAERVEQIHRRSEGNPLFLRELLRLSSGAAEPEGIREVVRARLSLLTPAVRNVLEAAAVLGREFALDPLEAIARDPQIDLGLVLSSAADAGIVEPLEQLGRWRFTHVLLREGLYGEIPADRRTALHHTAARELERRIGGPPVAELAHHLLHAIPLAAIGEAVDATIRASERAMDLLAYENASAMLARAAKLLESVPGEERRLFEVLLGLGGAYIRAAEIQLGKKTCKDAADLARLLGDGELFARAVLGAAYEHTPGARDLGLIALLEEALAMLPPGDGAPRARCMAQLAAERQPELDPEGPIALARDAVAMARRLGDPETLRFTLSTAGLAMLPHAPAADRIAFNQEALPLALSSGDKLVVLRAHLFLQASLRELGDLSGAEAHLRAHERLMREFRHGRFRWVEPGLNAAIALWDGRFDEAEREHRELERIAREDDTRGISARAFPAGLCRAKERYEELPKLEAELRASFGSLKRELPAFVAELLIVQLYARAGDREKTQTLLGALRASPLFSELKAPAWLALLVEPCHLLGDRALAPRLHDALLPVADQAAFLGAMGAQFEPPYHRDLGLLCLTLGRIDEAIEHLEKAEVRTASVGPRSHLARARLDLARALIARGLSEDLSSAFVLLERARELAEALGQTALLPLIDAHIGQARNGDRRASSPGKPELRFSLEREGEYWAVRSGARTLRLKDSRGLRVLDRLLQNPGQEFHVLQLASHPGGAADEGDAGPVLDEAAVHGYRSRLLELREELEEAERFQDSGRAELSREEMELLTQELARAVGLGGRARRTGGAAERARTAVQKRLRNAIQRIEEGLPDLARHLDQTIRTGAFCGYLPEGRPRGHRG
jgi:hypothetical protein